VARWEPLPDTVDGSMRRFVTQLRRMKDLSGLSVPALAVRTARATQAWEEYLAGVRLPPLDAVEVLAQLSGADHRRARALYLAAERGDPDPGGRVDGWRGALRRPWGPRGRHRRRAVVTAFAAGLLPTAAVAVLMATGMTTEGTGFTPAAPGHAAASGTPGTTPGAVPDRTATHRPAVAAPGATGGTSRAARARHPGDAPSTDAAAAVGPGAGSTPGTGRATTPEPGTTHRAGTAPSPGPGSQGPGSGPGSGSGGAQGSGGASGDASGGADSPVGGGSGSGGSASSGGGGAAGPGQSADPTPSPTSGGGEPVCVRLLSVRVCL
jgi:hypothetical protein